MLVVLLVVVLLPQPKSVHIAEGSVTVSQTVQNTLLTSVLVQKLLVTLLLEVNVLVVLVIIDNCELDVFPF